MVSDDTEHACLVAEALAGSGGDVEEFRRRLAWGLRWWLATLPAGIGFATLRGIVRLWLGVPAERSGVFSAGNGPAMRSAVIGVWCGDRKEKMRALVRASTRLTHTDPKAEWAAYAVALAAANCCDGGVQPAQFQRQLSEDLGPPAAEFLRLTEAVADSVSDGETTEDFAVRLGWGQGPSGYCFESVPAALHAWMLHQSDFRGTVTASVQCGGDADTTGAIAGALAGAQVGAAALPEQWVSGLLLWPRSKQWFGGLARAVAQSVTTSESRSFDEPPLAFQFLRNLLLLATAFGHVARRLFPPY